MEWDLLIQPQKGADKAMSVLKNKRSVSSLEFYHNAVSMRKEITSLLLRDFGVKNKVRDTVFLTKNMSEEDAKLFKGLCEKYDFDGAIEEYPEWLIADLRKGVMNLLRNLIQNITAANSIYPVHESEYYERRKLQNAAIANCEQLLQEFQYIIDILPVNANKYLRYVDMIEKQIALLKGWRKSDNRILKRVRENQNKEENLDNNKESE